MLGSPQSASSYHDTQCQQHSLLLTWAPSRHTPITMPSISSTPRAPATTPPRNRPTAVTLLESVFAGQSLSTSTCARVMDTVQTGVRSCYCNHNLLHYYTRFNKTRPTVTMYLIDGSRSSITTLESVVLIVSTEWYRSAGQRGSKSSLTRNTQ